MVTNQKYWEILIWLRAWTLAKEKAFEPAWQRPRIRNMQIRRYLQAAQEELERETIFKPATMPA